MSLPLRIAGVAVIQMSVDSAASDGVRKSKRTPNVAQRPHVNVTRTNDAVDMVLK